MRYFIVCLFLSLFIFSCDNTSKITLTKLEGSPAYENAKLEIDTIAFKEQEYSFKFNVLDYNLGEQTEKEFSFDLANSGKGQHIHFIVNNGPYSAYYSNEFNKKLESMDISLEEFVEKITIESLWNQMIYEKYKTKIKIDKSKLENEISSKKIQTEFNLSEIVFNVDKKENLLRKINLIKSDIENKGFDNAALIHSVSQSRNSGGVLGWINENSLNNKLKFIDIGVPRNIQVVH